MKHFALFVTIAAAVLLLATGPARAELWEHYRSETGMFEVDFPSAPEISYSRMRTSIEDVVQYSEMKLTEPIEGAPGQTRHYLIRLDQTWGDNLFLATTDNYLGEVLKRYKEHFESIGGEVIDTSSRRWNGFRGQEIRIHLPVDGDTQIGVIARFYADQRTKVQQMVIAPVAHLDNYRTSKFLSSLRLDKYDPKQGGAIYPDWKVTPLDRDGRISVIVPPAAPPYLEEPVFSEKGPLRKLSAVFLDPFYQKHMLFNAYLYDFGQTKITQSTFDRFILENHVGKAASKRHEVEHLELRDDIRGVEYYLVVDPIPGYDGIERKYVKGYYVNNFFDHSYIIVLETIGSRRAIENSFLENALVRSLSLELNALGIDPNEEIEVKVEPPPGK
ncbi:MAG: hypothetical protein EOM26_08270 [Alphaproteobacteria bacterium]|nr:hypothetical protein [Alphaproteobacteria bacterium]